MAAWKWRNDRRSERNLCNYVKKPEKNSGLQRGLNPWPRDLPVRCSTNCAMKPLGSRSIVGSYAPMKEMSVNDIWNKSYMNCGNEMKMKKWSSQWTRSVVLLCLYTFLCSQMSSPLVNHATGQGRKEDARPCVTSVTLILFEITFRQTSFSFKQAFS